MMYGREPELRKTIDITIIAMNLNVSSNDNFVLDNGFVIVYSIQILIL